MKKIILIVLFLIALPLVQASNINCSDFTWNFNYKCPIGQELKADYSCTSEGIKLSISCTYPVRICSFYEWYKPTPSYYGFLPQFRNYTHYNWTNNMWVELNYSNPDVN